MQNFALADTRILKGAPATLTFTPLDSDGLPVEAQGTITVGITRANGDELVAPGSPVDTSDDAYTYDLTSEQSSTLDCLTATWTDSGGGVATTTHEIVGKYFFAHGELRALDGMDDPSKITNQRITEVRKEVEDTIENDNQVSWVPRLAIETHVLTGWRNAIVLYRQQCRRLISVSVNDVDQDISNLTLASSGVLQYPYYGFYPAFNGLTNVVVQYEHGYAAPTNALKRAARDAARMMLLQDKNRISARALDVSDGLGGTIRYSQPGPDRPFGIPDVDAVVVSHRHGGSVA